MFLAFLLHIVIWMPPSDDLRQMSSGHQQARMGWVPGGSGIRRWWIGVQASVLVYVFCGPVCVLGWDEAYMPQGKHRDRV